MNRKIIKLAGIIIAQQAMIYTAIKVANRYSVWIGMAILIASALLIRPMALTLKQLVNHGKETK